MPPQKAYSHRHADRIRLERKRNGVATFPGAVEREKASPLPVCAKERLLSRDLFQGRLGPNQLLPHNSPIDPEEAPGSRQSRGSPAASKGFRVSGFRGQELDAGSKDGSSYPNTSLSARACYALP